MKSTVLLFCLIYIVSGLSFADEPLDLQLRLDPGDKYICAMEMTRIVSQTFNDEQQKLDQSLTVHWDYVVKEIDDDGNLLLEMTYKKVKILQDLGFQKSEYDSDNPPSYIEPSVRGYASLIGSKLGVKIDRGGNVRSIEGADELVDRIIDNLDIPDSPRKERIISDIRKQFGEEALRESIRQLTAFYPSGPVSIGDSWENVSGEQQGFPMIIENEYSLVSRKDGIANIDLSSEIVADSTDDSIDVGGLTLTYDVDGQQYGTIEVDEKTGLPIRSDIQMEFEGTVTGSGIDPQNSRSWPIKSSGRVIITFTKE